VGVGSARAAPAGSFIRAPQSLRLSHSRLIANAGARSYIPTMTANSQIAHTAGNGASGSLVIFTRVEGLLRERTRAPNPAASEPLRFLAGYGVPLVLVSAWEATELLELQREFALHQPFICEDGAALHVPRAWPGDPPAGVSIDDDTAWEVFRFSPASVSDAFTLVRAMFLARGYDPLLTVGIGCDLADYTLLTAVDIPIVVRNRSARQSRLLRELPGVYVTSASGAAGWSEALLGTSG